MRRFNPLVTVIVPFGETVRTHDPLFADDPPNFEAMRTHDPLMYPKPRINPGISRNSGYGVLNLLLIGRKSDNNGTTVLNYANAANRAHFKSLHTFDVQKLRAIADFNPLVTVIEPFGEPVRTHNPLFVDNRPIFETTQTHDPLMHPKSRINSGISRNNGPGVLNLLLKGGI